MDCPGAGVPGCQVALRGNLAGMRYAGAEMRVSRATVVCLLLAAAACAVLAFFVFAEGSPVPASDSPVGRGGSTGLPDDDRPRAQRPQPPPGARRGAATSRHPGDALPTAGDPGDEAVSLLTDRAGAEIAKGDYPAAEELADRCLVVAPENDACRRIRLRSLIGNGHHQAARPLLVECLDRDPDDVHCLSGMVAAHLSSRELEPASALAAHLAAIDPDSLWSRFAQANVLAAQGKRNEAAPHYEAACTLGQQAACRLAD